MQLNQATQPIRTHEGATARHIGTEQQLRRSVMSCMLWENEFYEDGQEIAARICSLANQLNANLVSAIAIEAREKMKLRHVPLLLCRELARNKRLKATTLTRVIQRPDELSEFLAIYWKDKRQPLAAQVKKGLAEAFTKFSAYQLAKYNRDHAIKLRDVLFLCHAKPKNAEQEAIWKQLIGGTLPVPDTWEVALSSGADKKDAWTRLLSERKLGGLALLRNLRNMAEAGVGESLIKEAIRSMSTERILPFRFIAAARYAPQLEPVLEEAMFRCVADAEQLSGTTVLLVDVSGSMSQPLSGKSDMTRLDAACGLAMLLREICPDVYVLTFSSQLIVCPSRRGFALRDAVTGSQPHRSTHLGMAVREVAKRFDESARLIVITDEQSHDAVPDQRGYLINVASAKHGVGYGQWTHIDGWSESVVRFINEMETER